MLWVLDLWFPVFVHEVRTALSLLPYQCVNTRWRNGAIRNT